MSGNSIRHETTTASYSEDTHPVEEKEEHQKGQEDRTLVGSSVSKSFNDVTAFTSEGRVVIREYDTPREDVTLFSTVHPKEESSHSIEDFLSRAVKIDTVQFQASHTIGKIITYYDVINRLRTAPAFSAARAKMQNFYGARFTVKLRVTLNPQPFECGMFQVFFVPQARTIKPCVDVTDTNLQDLCKLPFATSCPNVLCNIATQSEVELSIPYTGPAPFINLTNFYTDFGTFYIQSLAAISDSTNNASCDLSVYMSFHDVVLFGTAAYFLPTAPTSAAAGPQYQMLQAPKNEATMKQGPITNIATNLVPLLDSLGLSAPVANENPNRVSIAPFANPASADTVKNAFKISYLDAHKINVAPLGIDNADEMNINYLLKKPTFLTGFLWKASDEENKKVYSLSVEPNCSTFQSKDANFLVSAPNRLRYISQTFRYWRGTIRYYVHVVANKFHSGRLRFSYITGGYTTDDFPSFYPKVFTHVVDLRDATNFVVECPYFGTAPWRSVFNDYKDGHFVPNDVEKTSPFYDPPSTLLITVENQLRASPSVAQEISVLVFSCAGDDYELAVPVTSSSTPTFTYVKPAATVPRPSLRPPVPISLPPVETQIESSNDATTLTQAEADAMAKTIQEQANFPLPAEHLMYYFVHQAKGKGDLGPFMSMSRENHARAVAAVKIAPFLKGFLENYERARNISSTGEHPQALDMTPINMVAPTQRLAVSGDPTHATVGEKITSIRQLIKRYQIVGAGERVITSEDKRPVFVFAPFFQIKPTTESNFSSDMLSYFYPLFRYYRGSMRYLITSNNPSLQWNVKYDPTYKFSPSYKSTDQFGPRVGIKEIEQFPTGYSFNSSPMVGFIPYNLNLQGSLEIEFPYYNRYPKVYTQYWDSNNNIKDYNDSTFKGFTPLGFVLFEMNDYSKGGDYTIFKMLRAAADDFNFGYCLGPPLCRVNPNPTL